MTGRPWPTWIKASINFALSSVNNQNNNCLTILETNQTHLCISCCISIYQVFYKENINISLHAYMHTHTHTHIHTGLMSRVFTNGLGDWGSIPGWVISKTKKMVFDSTWLITQQYKIRIKSKVEQSREWSSALPYTSVW